MGAALERVGATETDWVAWCWPDHIDTNEIYRIVVVDGVVYTVARRSVQATSLDTLTPIASTAL